MTPQHAAPRTPAPDSARRSFMAVSLCAPAAAAGVLLGLPAAPPLPTALTVAAPAAPQGYQVSDHIRQYYARARY